MMLNFKTVMITDGNAAVTDDDHNASLIGFYLIFGDIMSTDFAIGCLKRNTQKGLAARNNPPVFVDCVCFGDGVFVCS